VKNPVFKLSQIHNLLPLSHVFTAVYRL